MARVLEPTSRYKQAGTKLLKSQHTALHSWSFARISWTRSSLESAHRAVRQLR